MIDWKRWGVLSIHKIGTPEDPYLDRYRLLQTPLFAVYVHHIHRADADPDPHDHPWWFASIVLRGAYIEHVYQDKANPGWLQTRLRERFSLRSLSRHSAHIISSIYGSLWTLVITGPDHGEWGFWANGRFTPWQGYFAQKEMKTRHGGQPWNTMTSIPVIKD